MSACSRRGDEHREFTSLPHPVGAIDNWARSLRQTFVEWAAQTVNKSFWAGACYRQQMAKGASHQAAVRALAFKWIRILYRGWQTRTPTTN